LSDYFNFILERSFWVYVEKISNNFYNVTIILATRQDIS